MPGTFLIADDSAPKRGMLKMMLRRAQWDGEVVETVTTDDAIARIDARPDIAAAFIDYQMPSTTGIDVIRHLRQTCPRAKIALVTAQDSARYDAEARAAGSDAFVCTSWASDHLERTLLALLDEWRA